MTVDRIYGEVNTLAQKCLISMFCVHKLSGMQHGISVVIPYIRAPISECHADPKLKLLGECQLSTKSNKKSQSALFAISKVKVQETVAIINFFK